MADEQNSDFYIINNVLIINKYETITKLYCNYMNISSIDLLNCIKLEHFDCSNNNISSIDLSNYVNLRMLQCPKNNISTIDLSSCVDLRELRCHRNKISLMNLSSCINLEYLYCCYNKILSIIKLKILKESYWNNIVIYQKKI